MVVEKLWPAVPESSFILVAFQNELFAVTKSVTLTEVLRDAAHEKIGLLFRRVKNPSEHRSRGRLSMRTADDDGMLFREKDFFQNFRHRAIRNLAVKHFFQLRISSRDDISDYHQVGRRLHVRGIKSVKERNTEAFKQS